jgi:hypothetical protein
MARFLSIKSSLAAVSAAVLLAACGGSNGVTLGTTDLPAITVDNLTQATAEQYAALLQNKWASLPVGVIFTEAGAPNVSAGTSFKFTPIPTGAPSNAISGFTLNSAQGTFSGYIAAGSTILCGQGTWNSVTYPNVNNPADADGNACFTINGDMTLDPNTKNLTGGSQNVDISVVITGGGQTSTSTVTTTLTITLNNDGTATITDPTTGTNFTVDSVEVTGSTGGTT